MRESLNTNSETRESHLMQVETLSEGHVFAEKTGLGTENLHKFIEGIMGGLFTSYSTRLVSAAYLTEEV